MTAPDDPPLYTPGRVTIGQPGDDEPGSEDDR